ncbi:MAG: isocitrate/isopropylmalate dehydrogenase family protein [Sulfolobales archaeon]
MSGNYRIGVLRGDGIGPELMDVTLKTLNELGLSAEFIEVKAGYQFYKETGKLLEDGGVEILKKVDAILKGPITTPLSLTGFRSVNIMLRRELNLYANVRPFKSFRGVSLRDLNIVLIRENTEDLYVGIEGIHYGSAVALKFISERATERIIDFAFNYALKHGFKKVTVVHKSNVLRITDGLFRDIFFRRAKDHPGLETSEVLVDSAAYQLIKNPRIFEVIVTENLYGDILADLIAGLVGSLGLCGSAEVGGSNALFEPVHGSAPDIAGKGVANPISQLISAKLMLEYLGETHSDPKLITMSNALDRAITQVVEEGRVLTPELGGNSSTSEVANEVLRKALSFL